MNLQVFVAEEVPMDLPRLRRLLTEAMAGFKASMVGSNPIPTVPVLSPSLQRIFHFGMALLQATQQYHFRLT
jgi:hypothetical protein